MTKAPPYSGKEIHLFTFIRLGVWAIRATYLYPLAEAIASPSLRLVYSTGIKFALWVIPAFAFAYRVRCEAPFHALGFTTFPSARQWLPLLLIVGTYLGVIIAFETLTGQKALAFTRPLPFTFSDFLFTFASPLIEEILFRGLMLKEFARLMPLWRANLLPSLLMCVLFSLRFHGVRSASTTYYLSEAGNDENPGTLTHPWRSLARLQTALDSGGLEPGDQILFARGATFTGTLTLNADASGTALAPLTFGAYGTGTPPVLSGLQPLPNWEALGNNHWRAVCEACSLRPALLAIQGLPQPLARWPNLDEADGGYRYFTSASGRLSLTDPSLPDTPNWAGGEVVVRSIAWVLDHLPIVSHSIGTLLTSEPASYDLEVGYGYFIQNHLAALDQAGEWVYSAMDKTITLQWPANPNTLLIEVPLSANLIEVSGSEYVVFQDLALLGAQNNLFQATSCVQLTLQRMAFRLAGNHALYMDNCPASLLSHSTVADSMNNGLNLWACPDCRVTDTTIERVGLFAGLGGNGDGQYMGVQLMGEEGAGALFEQNTVRDMGYLGLYLGGHATVRNNVVQGWNRVKTDGAGIYTYQATESAILDNIVMDGYGSTAGTPWTTTGTNGLYIDDESENILVSGNTVGQISGAGIFLHNTRAVTVTENLVFATSENGVLLVDDDLGTYGLEDSSITHNTIIVAGVPVLNVFSSLTGALFNTLGTIDQNLFCDPFGPVLFQVELPGTGSVLKRLPQWQAEHARDLTSTLCAELYPTHTVIGPPGANLILNGTFDTDLDGWFGWPDDTLHAVWETGRLDGGSLSLGYNGPAPTLHYDYPIGAVQSGQTYRLQLSALAVDGLPALTAYLRQSGDPYTQVTSPLPLWVNPQRTEHEIFLDVTTDEADTLLIFELNSPGMVVGIDNVVLQPLPTAHQGLTDITRFEVNLGNTPKTVVLDGYLYHDAQGTVYPAGSQILLAPFTGLVLFRHDRSGYSIYLPLLK